MTSINLQQHITYKTNYFQAQNLHIIKISTYFWLYIWYSNVTERLSQLIFQGIKELWNYETIIYWYLKNLTHWQSNGNWRHFRWIITLYYTMETQRECNLPTLWLNWYHGKYHLQHHLSFRLSLNIYHLRINTHDKL